jgi:hypothetical protein
LADERHSQPATRPAFRSRRTGENTLVNYRDLAAKHIRPLIGTMKVEALARV